MPHSFEFLGAMFGGRPDKNQQGLDERQAETIRNHLKLGLEGIRELAVRYCATTEFKRGDIVRVKRGLSNMRWPVYGQPVVVIDYVPDQIDDKNEESFSPKYRAPKNLRFALIDGDGEYEFWWADANRFELCPENEIELMHASLEQQLAEYDREQAEHKTKAQSESEDA